MWIRNWGAGQLDTAPLVARNAVVLMNTDKGFYKKDFDTHPFPYAVYPNGHSLEMIGERMRLHWTNWWATSRSGQPKGVVTLHTRDMPERLPSVDSTTGAVVVQGDLP